MPENFIDDQEAVEIVGVFSDIASEEGIPVGVDLELVQPEGETTERKTTAQCVVRYRYSREGYASFRKIEIVSWDVNGHTVEEL